MLEEIGSQQGHSRDDSANDSSSKGSNGTVPSTATSNANNVKEIATTTKAAGKATVSRIYSLEEYGITEADIISRFAAYIDRYKELL